MSSIIKNKGIVHYEVFGRGRPVILLHGWLGSWGLWQETMAYLGQQYRTYASDFRGFGESGKKRESYAVQDFVRLVVAQSATIVDQFMALLGIARAPLVGHSMGDAVTKEDIMVGDCPTIIENIVAATNQSKGSVLAVLAELDVQIEVGLKAGRIVQLPNGTHFEPVGKKDGSVNIMVAYWLPSVYGSTLTLIKRSTLAFGASG